MDILLSSDVFKVFFSKRSIFNKSETEKIIVSIFENQNNKIILSKRMLELIENSIEEINKDVYTVIIENIISTKSINIPAKINCNEKEALNEMYNNYKISNHCNDLFLCISIEESFSIKTKNSIIIDKVQKPNWDWLLLKVASQNPETIDIRYYEFPSNQHISNLFDKLFTICEKINYVCLYDKQHNLTHKYFQELRTNVLVHYFTSVKNKDKTDVVKTIKNHFKKVKIFESRPNYVHERRLILNNLIIETDDDFQNLTYDRPTWKLSIIYCPKTALELRKKESQFNRCDY